MDKGLMALMGIEDDIQVDDGLATQPLDRNQSEEPSDFFEPMSDSDNDMPAPSAAPKSTYLQSRQSKPTPEECSSPPSSPPLAPRASTSSLFASSRVPRSPSPPRARASTSSLFSPGLSPSKVRITKSPKKNRNGGSKPDEFSMFSPTLSPRKPKRTTSSISSSSSPAPKSSSSTPITTFPSRNFSAFTTPSHGKDVRTTSLSPDLPPVSGQRRGPASPISSYELQNQTHTLSDVDSDISSMEDNDYSKSSSLPESQKVSLRASYTLDANMGMDLDDSSDDELPTVEAAIKEIPVMNVSQSREQDNDSDGDLDNSLDHDPEMDEIMAAYVKANKATKKSKAAIQKEEAEMQMEKERLLRSSTYKVDQRFKKQTLSSLLESAQSKLKGQPVAPKGIQSSTMTPKSPLKKRLPRTIALDDSSEDETEQDVERREDEALWKRSASRALLLSTIPKRERGLISLELKASAGPVSVDRRMELERALHMSPLSNKIQNMTLNKTPDTSSSSTSTLSSMVSPPAKPNFSLGPKLGLSSPQKGQRPGTVANIRQYNFQMERQLAKNQLMRRKKLEGEAKKSGFWKSPEEHAADQLKNKEADEDDDEDEDYNPQDKPDDGGESDVNRGSADELGSRESGDEENAAGEEATADNGEAVPESDYSEDDEDDDVDEDDEEKVAPVKRAYRKTVIGDDDDVKVVIVDRSQAFVESESDDHDDDHDDDDHDDEVDAEQTGSGSDVDDDDDVSDIEQDMEGVDGTQGFGAFFESSYDPKKSKQAGALRELGRAPTSAQDSSLSPIVGSDPSQLQASFENTQGSIDGALDFLSGKFPTQTQQGRSSSVKFASFESQGLPSLPSQGTAGFGSQLPMSMESEIFDDDNDREQTAPFPTTRNAFDVMSAARNQDPGLQRLHKREAKLKRSKGEKSAFIEYEAEEEEDEHMGMGGIDYESDVDQDDYDLADGMLDTNLVLDHQDAENVKQLHMKHEQDQHEKEISDLVHGIAAGNLWKRRNGQIDDLDIFDEEDMDGRFRRKKKLKVSEKFSKLADNPNTAAFARAFKKNMDDDQLVFLSDADESADENEPSKDDEDEDEDDDRESQRSTNMESGGEDDDEEESLNTDKRQERLRKARLDRDESFNGSMDPDAMAAMTKGQVLPFNIESEDELLFEDHKSSRASSTPLSLRIPTKGSDSSRRVSASQAEAVDEYKDVMRRTKVIRDILDGVDEEGEDETMASPVRGRSSLFGLVDRIVDRTSMLSESSSAADGSVFGSGALHNEVDLTAIVQPRMLARQNSSFLSEDRRNQFLSTVGGDNRGGNASTRVVKEVNRRKMAFATSTKSTSSSGSFSSSSSAAVGTFTTTTTTTTTMTSATRTSLSKTAAPKNAGVQGASGSNGGVGGGSSRLLQILSLEEEE
ncbi:hypothetical protein BGX24_009397 [Mortierella sp. AD032]|nr:hypothetical protein BGX24_009397 [Mortierella sp. AD032]